MYRKNVYGLAQNVTNDSIKITYSKMWTFFIVYMDLVYVELCFKYTNISIDIIYIFFS